jgi:hypothetical protein
MADTTIEDLGEGECLWLIATGGIGRIAYESRFGPARSCSGPRGTDRSTRT